MGNSVKQRMGGFTDRLSVPAHESDPSILVRNQTRKKPPKPIHGIVLRCPDRQTSANRPNIAVERNDPAARLRNAITRKGEIVNR